MWFFARPSTLSILDFIFKFFQIPITPGYKWWLYTFSRNATFTTTHDLVSWRYLFWLRLQQWKQRRITDNNIIIFIPGIFDTTIIGVTYKDIMQFSTDTWSKKIGTSWDSVWSSNIALRQSLEIGDWTTWGWCVIYEYRLRLICSLIFECPFRFVLIHWPVPTLMALRLDFSATRRHSSILTWTRGRSEERRVQV